MPTALKSIVPRLNPDCDVRALPLTPQEGFVLSRVDGKTNADEIGQTTGMPDTVLEALTRLATLGAILDIPGVEPPKPPRRASSKPSPPVIEAPPAVYDLALLDEDVEIELPRKKRILDIFHRLETLSHYQVLGLERTADKKEIKAAYYQLAPEFHPDKFFRKNLGSYKAKLETVFKRLTEAQEVLSRNATRAEYDVYLEDRLRAEAIERLLRGEDEPPPPPPLLSIAPPPVTEPPPPSPRPNDSRLPLPSTRPPSVHPERSAEDDRRRRQTLAAKLASGRFPVTRARDTARPPAPETPPKPPGIGARAATEVLKKMQAARSVEDHRAHSQRLRTAAEDAAARDDAVSAANAFRLLSAMLPDDAGVHEAEEMWKERAAASLAPTYLKQAEYEAKEGKWPEAARSYMRALAGMPDDARLLNLTAQAMLKGGIDLHQAAEHAKKAIALLPEKLVFRLTLAEVYLAANLPLNARREVEAAAKINAQDEGVRAMLKRIG